MTTQKNSSPKAAAAAVTAGSGRESAQQNLETIRDILVGEEMQTTNARFQTLEKSLEVYNTRMVDQLKFKFEAVQALGKSEIDVLRKEIGEKETCLQAEDSMLSEEIEATNKRIENLGKTQGEMKTDLTDQIRKMQEDFAKQVKELTRMADLQREEMNRTMVARDDFANLLSSVAANFSAGDEEQKISA